MEDYRHKFLIVKEEGSGAPKGTICKNIPRRFCGSLATARFSRSKPPIDCDVVV